jgi:hypothetical protein
VIAVRQVNIIFLPYIISPVILRVEGDPKNQVTSYSKIVIPALRNPLETF